MDSQTNDYGNDRNNLLRNRQIILASWIGIGLNALLAVAKIAIGIGDNSFAVISDGVDSGVDILTSVITLLAAGLMMRPPEQAVPLRLQPGGSPGHKSPEFFHFLLRYPVDHRGGEKPVPSYYQR
jgi:hypothetical protein